MYRKWGKSWQKGTRKYFSRKKLHLFLFCVPCTRPYAREGQYKKQTKHLLSPCVCVSGDSNSSSSFGSLILPCIDLTSISFVAVDFAWVWIFFLFLLIYKYLCFVHTFTIFLLVIQSICYIFLHNFQLAWVCVWFF